MVMDIKIEADYTHLDIYLDTLPHLSITLEGLKGFQSWKDDKGFYCIEYYYSDSEPILSEYYYKETWEGILKLLGKIIK